MKNTVSALDEDGNPIVAPSLSVGLFYGRDTTPGTFIEIGRQDGYSKDTLRIEITRPTAKDMRILRGIVSRRFRQR